MEPLSPELIAKEPLSVRTDAAIQEAAAGMRDAGVGALPVVDKSDELAGIVTDRDIAVRAVAEGLEAETPVERVMTRKLIAVEASDALEDGLSLMREHQIRRLPVVEGERLVGIVAQADIAAAGLPPGNRSADSAVRLGGHWFHDRGGGTVRRISRVRGLVLTGVVLALGAMVLLAPGRATAAHEDCTLVVNPPGNYGNIFAISSASVECASVKRVIHLSLVLTVDGTIADSSDRTCHRRADCPTYVIVNDAPGDQVWCTTASARVGGHSLGPVTRCETEAIP